MTDAKKRPTAPLGLLAELVGGRVEGDEATEVDGVAPVDEATSSQLAFLAVRRYLRYVDASAAAAFLVSPELREHVPDGRTCIVVDDPYPALRTLLAHFVPERPTEQGVHPTAVLGRGVELGPGVSIAPYAVLGPDVRIGAGSVVGAHTVVGRGSSVGAGCYLHPHVVVYEECVIGSEVVVHSGACIGPDGFGYTLVDGEHRKMPQVGRAVIGDRVEIGANTTIDRGSLGDTVVGEGVKIDNLVQVAHNVRIGARSLLAALVGIAGSTRLGRRTWVGGQAGVINQIEVGDEARIAVASAVMRDVPPGQTVSGSPARPHRAEMRKQAYLARLPLLVERVDRLEETLERLSGAP